MGLVIQDLGHSEAVSRIICFWPVLVPWLTKATKFDQTLSVSWFLNSIQTSIYQTVIVCPNLYKKEWLVLVPLLHGVLKGRLYLSYLHILGNTYP